MKILLTLFVLLFSSSVFADDISDFEIEGISIGDSLLDYFTEEEIHKEIESNSEQYKYLNNTTKFGEIYIFKGENFKTYENLSFFVKPEDKNYIIFAIRGMLDYVEDLEGCLKKQKEIENEIVKILTQFNKREGTLVSKLDPSGKSISYHTELSLKTGGDIDIRCSNWEENLRKKNNWTEGLSVAMTTKEFSDWITDY